MSISSKIKALLKIKNIEHSALAEYLGISRQGLSNKFFRGSFSAEDLIKIADFLNCNLCFVIDANQKITLDKNDIKNSVETIDDIIDYLDGKTKE